MLTVTPDIMSNTISYFGSGSIYPAGQYIFGYATGAHKTNVALQWCVSEYVPGDEYYAVIGSSQYGCPWTNHYSTEALCWAGNAGNFITLNVLSPSAIGGVLNDTNYTDNYPGTPNPTFYLLGFPLPPTANPTSPFDILVETPVMPAGADFMNIFISTDNTNFTLVKSSVSANTQYLITGLNPLTKYYFEVDAGNTYNTLYSSSVSATTYAQILYPCYQFKSTKHIQCKSKIITPICYPQPIQRTSYTLQPDQIVSEVYAEGSLAITVDVPGEMYRLISNIAPVNRVLALDTITFQFGDQAYSIPVTCWCSDRGWMIVGTNDQHSSFAVNTNVMLYSGYANKQYVTPPDGVQCLFYAQDGELYDSLVQTINTRNTQKCLPAPSKPTGLGFSPVIGDQGYRLPRNATSLTCPFEQ